MRVSRRRGPTGSEPFVNRNLLGSSTLDHAWSSLDRLDALHIVGTHGRHGVAEGLDVTVVDHGQGLDVTPGAAYTPCGQLIVVDCPTRFDRPPMPGPHAVWLRRDGQIVGQPFDRPRPVGAVFVGRADASQHRYWQTVDQSGRTSIPRPVPPQVASSRLTLDLRDIDVDRTARTLSTTIDTGNGAFESAPLYFVTIAVRDRLEEGHLQRITGWSTTICSPGANSFTLQVHLLAEDSIWDDLETYKALSGFLGGLVSFVVFDVVWIGVDPRRPGTSPIDPHCFTPIVLFPVLVTPDTSITEG